jgi:hypothetical protein
MSKCPEVDPELTLPSGCQLVKINLPRSVLNSILRPPASNSSGNDSPDEISLVDVNDFASSSSLNRGSMYGEEDEEEEEKELVMDGLSESTRFTTNVALDAAYSERLVIGENDSALDLMDGNGELEPCSVYVQRNSHLKIVMLGSSTQSEPYQLENILRIVSVTDR